MGCTVILSVKVSVKKITGPADKNCDVDGTCKRSLTALFTKPLASRVLAIP